MSYNGHHASAGGKSGLCCCCCCFQALLLHNQVMRHACYDNIGFVLEQEGDSYTLAFHEPQDAVAFTLQVRVMQCLRGRDWEV